ncbi:MAG: hypothetical protein AAFN00_05150 [Cyanobacteria bacterium J06558_2]
MAKTDLTFTELDTALGGGALTLERDDIKISVKAITRDTYDNLSNEGVVEFIYKLRAACTTAQDVANAALPDGEEALSSFPAFTFSPPADGLVTVTQSQTVQIPLNTQSVIGTSV